MTKIGLDPLLPESENTAQIVEPPTEEEMNSAITNTVGHILAVVSLSCLHFCCPNQNKLTRDRRSKP